MSSKVSSVNKNADQAKEKLYKNLVKDLTGEFSKTGNKLIKNYGGDNVMKKAALEYLNSTVNGMVEKKMMSVEYKDTEAVQKQFSRVAKTINKEAERAETVLLTADGVVQQFGGLGKFGELLRMILGPLLGKKTDNENKAMSIIPPVKETITKGLTLVEKYGDDCERIDKLYTAETCCGKFKLKMRQFCCCCCDK